MDNHDYLVGQIHKFEDGDSIQVIQIKRRSEDLALVSYYIQQGPGIPRKLVMELQEFLDHYGHLFKE